MTNNLANFRMLLALGESFGAVAAECGDDRTGMLLARMAQGFATAAKALADAEPPEPEQKPEWMPPGPRFQ